MAKGMQKWKTTILVSIFTKESERVDVYHNNFGWDGDGNWWYGGYYGNSVSRTTEGTLYIDFIDANTNELVWQGMGTSRLITSGDVEAKEERIKEIARHENLANILPINRKEKTPWSIKLLFWELFLEPPLQYQQISPVWLFGFQSGFFIFYHGENPL